MPHSRLAQWAERPTFASELTHYGVQLTDGTGADTLATMLAGKIASR